MPKRKWLLAALALSAGLTASSNASARAADKCLSKPNAPAPHGQHWYYNFDRVKKRQCWYLREAGLTVRRHAPQLSAQPVPLPPTRPTQAAPAMPPPDANFPAAAAPVPWLGTMDLLMRPPAAAPVARRVPSQIASAGGDPPAASIRTASANAPPPPDESAAARAREVPAPARDKIQQPPLAAAPAPTEAAAGNGPALALFVLLFAGLAVAGSLFLVARRRRALETAVFRPPPLAKVARLDAFALRIGVPVPHARRQEIAEPPTVPLLAPAIYTERLAQALQELADRLREQPGPAPSIVPGVTGYEPPCGDDTPERRAGRPLAADVFGVRGIATARAHGIVRRFP